MGTESPKDNNDLHTIFLSVAAQRSLHSLLVFSNPRKTAAKAAT